MKESRRSRLIVPLGVAIVAAGLTWVLYLAKTLPVVGDLLAFGVIVAMIPFGGLHDAPFSDQTVMLIGAIVNGLIWGALAHIAQRTARSLRRNKSAIDEHVI